MTRKLLDNSSCYSRITTGELFVPGLHHSCNYAAAVAAVGAAAAVAAAAAAAACVFVHWDLPFLLGLGDTSDTRYNQHYLVKLLPAV